LKIMNAKQVARVVARSIFLIILFFSFFSGPLLSRGKKLRVIAHKADIYLNADKKSPIIATVEEGTILTLYDTGKVKKIWNHVYFTSKKTGMTKSGYILGSLVEKLFVVTKIITIKGEEESPEEKLRSQNYFRKTYWGMSKAKILELEGEPPHQEKSYGLDIIRYQQKIRNIDCLIVYIFAENKLIKAKYIFLEEHKFKNRHIGDYKKIKDWLTEMHGMPKGSNVTWRNDLYKEDFSKWGLAVSLGHLEYSSLWKTPKTEILLSLSGENEKVSLDAEYTELKPKYIK